MKLLTLFTSAALLLASNAAFSATQDLDKLLQTIKADIAAKRLSRPSGNNALDHISQFREQAPFDFRVVPLAYEVGEAYVALANKEVKAGNSAKAQQYLDIVWQLAALTPGLEEAQAKINKSGKGKKVAKKAPKKDTAAEKKRQKALAVAAAKEKARLDAQRKQKAKEDRARAAQAKKEAAALKKQKQLAERRAREEASKAKVAKTKKTLAPKAAPRPARVAAAKPSLKVEMLKENRKALASYPVDGDRITARDRSIKKDLVPICQAIIDNNASVVLHATSKADYRWLTVRLTLCTRKLENGFRLRHSYEQVADGKDPFISLHPERTTSLLRMVN